MLKTSAPACYSLISIEAEGAGAHPPNELSFPSPYGLGSLWIPTLHPEFIAGSLPPANDATDTTVVTNKIATVIENPCNDDLIPLAGHLTFVFHFTTNDHTEVFLDHTILQGSGTGSVTGTEYTFNNTSNRGLIFPVGLVETIAGHGNIIAQGEVPDLVSHGIIHVTINANGEVTSDVAFGGGGCKV